MFKNLFASLLLLVALAVPSLAQNVAPTPVQAERVFLMMAGDPNLGPSYMTAIGLSTEGYALLLSQAQMFESTQIASIAASNLAAQNFFNGVGNPPDQVALMASRDAAVTNTFQILATELSATDYNVLEQFLTYETSNMSAQSPGDLVGYETVSKFGDVGGDGNDSGSGAEDFTYLDGFSGGLPTCSVDGGASDTVAINQWAAVATAPSGTAQLFNATDGTMLARTSSNNLYMYDFFSQSFLSMGGAGLEITGSATNGIYTVGTDNKLYSYNTWNAAWNAVSGSSYPFTTLNHVAADGVDGSVFASNGTQIAAYIPPAKKWIVLGNAASAPISLSAQFYSNDGPPMWEATWIGANGNFYYVLYFYSTNQTIWSGPLPYTDYTGTPQTIRLASDHSVTIHSSDGTTWQDGPWGQITGQSGSVASADGVNGVYVVTSNGTIMRWGGQKTTLTAVGGNGNYYFLATNVSPLNYFADGDPVSNPNDSSNEEVTQDCDTVRTVLFNNTKKSFIEDAKTLVYEPGLISTVDCGALDTGHHCANYDVTEDCLAASNPPDLMINSDGQGHGSVFTENFGQNVPWGFLETGLCISFTGKQPFHCLANSPGNVTTPKPAFACTSHR